MTQRKRKQDDEAASESAKRGRGRPPSMVEVVSTKDGAWMKGSKYPKGTVMQIEKPLYERISHIGVWKET